MVSSWAFLRLTLIAFSLGLDVFAVCVGVGIRGAQIGAKIRIGAAFAIAEVTMTALGAGLGRLLGALIGDIAAYFGYVALICVGAYMIFETIGESEGSIDLSSGWGLFLAAVSISLDSLGIGFSIMYVGVPFAVSLLLIAVVSVSCSSLGLLFGRLLGRRVEESAGVIAGVVLIVTGLVFAAMRYGHMG